MGKGGRGVPRPHTGHPNPTNLTNPTHPINPIDSKCCHWTKVGYYPYLVREEKVKIPIIILPTTTTTTTTTSHLLVDRESKVECSKVRVLCILDPQKTLVELSVQ